MKSQQDTQFYNVEFLDFDQITMLVQNLENYQNGHGNLVIFFLLNFQQITDWIIKISTFTLYLRSKICYIGLY